MKLWLISALVILSLPVSVQAYHRQDVRIICTMEFDPVCGEDGRTYQNRCVAEHRYNVHVNAEGECEETTICTAIYDPVCGVDGKTYANECVAERQNRVQVAYEGTCRAPSSEERKREARQFEERVNVRVQEMLRVSREFREDRQENHARFRETRKEVRDLLRECKEIEANTIVGFAVQSQTRPMTQQTRGNITANIEMVDACQEFRKEVKEDIAETLRHRINIWIRILEDTRARVAAQQGNATVENREEIIARIDATIARLKEIRATIDADVTHEELREITQELRELWQSTHQQTELYVVAAGNAGVKGVIQRGNQLENRMDTRIQVLRGQGMDVNALMGYQEEFSMHLDAAERLQVQAESQLEIGARARARALLKQAREELKEAHAALQAFIRAEAQLSAGGRQ